MPTPHIRAQKGEFAPIVLMPGDPLRAKYIAEHYLENITLISTGKINLMDAELNEFLLSYKNMLNKTIKVVMCENITEYDY